MRWSMVPMTAAFERRFPDIEQTVEQVDEVITSNRHVDVVVAGGEVEECSGEAVGLILGWDLLVGHVRVGPIRSTTCCTR